MLRRLLPILASTLIAAPAAADAFDDGVAALRRGDCAAAVALFGEAAGQANLGAKYFKCQGVTRDSAMSQMWFSLAADQGNATARANRDAIARDMPPWQIAEARRLAEEWTASHP